MNLGCLIPEMMLVLPQTSASQWLENKCSSDDSGDKATSLEVGLGTRMRVCQAQVLILSPSPGPQLSQSIGAITGITIGSVAVVALATGLACFLYIRYAKG